MKCLFVLTILACAFNISQGMTKEERFEHFKGLVNDCAGKEGASSTEVDAILAQQEPKTREGRCIAACIGDATGMVKNKMLDIEALVAVTKMGFDGDAAKMDLARGLGTPCTGITDGDRCEAAIKIFMCMKQQAMDKGLNSDYLD